MSKKRRRTRQKGTGWGIKCEVCGGSLTLQRWFQCLRQRGELHYKQETLNGEEYREKVTWICSDCFRRKGVRRSRAGRSTGSDD